MPVYQLGNGNQYFDSALVPDWTNDSSVVGGNGSDTIIVRGAYPFDANHILVVGGNGGDNITLDASNSVAIGGNGNNTLTSIGGLGNTLQGGNGDNLLISDGGGSGMGPGNTLMHRPQRVGGERLAGAARGDGQAAIGGGALQRNRTWGRLGRLQPGQQRNVVRPERRRPEQPGSSRGPGQAGGQPFCHRSHSRLAKPRLGLSDLSSEVPSGIITGRDSLLRETGCRKPEERALRLMLWPARPYDPDCDC